MQLGFILKKIISAFIMPLFIGVILLLIALIFLFKNDIKKTKIFLLIAFVWICLIAHTSFANLLLYPLENRYPKLQNIPQDVNYIVYLGGDQESRGWEVLRLYNKIKNPKIITSGYEGRGTIPEAIKTAKVLQDIGIDKKNIIIHPKPKDTQEEAIKIKSVLKDTPFILVTSAYHMPRAMMIFKKEGLNPIPAPTNFLIKDSDKLLSLPNGYSLYKTKRAWHEYIGILWIKLKDKLKML